VALVLSLLVLPVALPGKAAPLRKAPKVVLISFYATADWLVDEFLAQGGLPLGTEKFEHQRALKVVGNSPGKLEYKFKSATAELHALAVDHSFDGKENNDAILLDRDSDLSNGYIGELREGTWIQLEFPDREHVPAVFGGRDHVFPSCRSRRHLLW